MNNWKIGYGSVYFAIYCPPGTHKKNNSVDVYDAFIICKPQPMRFHLRVFLCTL